MSQVSCPKSEESFFIFLDKPIGLSSQQYLTQFKRKFGIQKIGHHGTLDPFATGLLLVGVNEATKFFQFVDDEQKTYEATILFGVKTDTLDHTGSVLAQKEVPDFSLSEIEVALQKLTGKIQQTPPMYSAIKQDGQKLYELARQGLEVERKVREVEIFSWRVLSWQKPYLKVSVTVSRGTYVRVLAEQVAELLGQYAHLTELRRSHLSLHGLESALSLDASQIPTEKKLPIAQLLNVPERFDLTADQLRDLYFGKLIPTSESEGKMLAAFYQENFVGIVTVTKGFLKSLRLLSQNTFSFSI